MKKLRIIAFAVLAFLQTKAQNVGVNTDGSTPASTNLFEVKQTSTANNSVGGYFSHTGSVGAGNTGYGIQVIKSGTTGTNIGGDFSVSGAATTNLAGRFSASGGTNNYALIVPNASGNIGFGTTAPTATNLLHVAQTSATNNSVGIFASHNGSATTGYSIWAEKTGAGTNNYAGYFSASGGTNNYGIVVPSGGGLNGFGTTTPSMLLDAVWNTTTNGNSVIRAQATGTTGQTVAVSGINSSTSNSASGVLGQIGGVSGILGHRDVSGTRWGVFSDNNAKFRGFLMVGDANPQTGVNSTFEIYNIDFDATKYWNLVLVTTSGTCATSVRWTYGASGLRYTFGGNRSNQRIVSTYIWIPNIYVSTLKAHVTHEESSVESNFDGTMLEFSDAYDGTWTRVTSWAANGYNGTATGGSDASCNSESVTKWTGTVSSRISESNAITGTPIGRDKWVVFGFRGSEDATTGSGGTSTFTKFRLTIIGSSAYPNNMMSGEIYAAGHIYAQSNSQIGDVAEFFPVSDESKPGMLISADPKSPGLYKISDSNDPNVIGVHSTTPSVFINNPNQGVPVALVGRAPVLISNENGKLQIGDYLTSSSKRGYAMKATEPCFTVGRVVSFIDENTVMAIIQPAWYNPVLGESVISSNSIFPKGKKKIKVYDSNYNDRSRVFVSFLGNPGSASWIEKESDGSFSICLEKETDKEVPFDYLISNPEIKKFDKPLVDKTEIENLVNQEIASGKEKEIIITPKSMVSYTGEREVWVKLGANGSSERVNIKNITPPPPPDPAQAWTWSPDEGFKQIEIKPVKNNPTN